MARGPHLLRRGAVYYWQRRLPTHLAKLLRISHVKVNLRTKDVAVARRLVPPLDVRAMEVFMDKSAEISREQLGSLFKAVLVEHQQKLGLLADIERANPTAERAELLETELAQGLAYKLLSEQGVNAHVHEEEQLRQLEEGRGADFIVKVIEHIARLHDGNEIKISRQRLARPVSGLDFAALLNEVRGGSAAAPDVTDESRPPSSPPILPEAHEPPAGRGGSTISAAADALAAKRNQDKEWDDKTSRQAKFIFGLFGRYMDEVHTITDMAAVRQHHLADFDGFLRSLHSNFGKNTKDPDRSIDEVRLVAKTEVPKHVRCRGQPAIAT